ncbi:hypothetical protein [Polyangium mundeleinium]|uniref:Uncharacterized protein n=1 Tax=Polyangium mundeleinium TaxID=2995306 RepID=A0ABT5EHV2_9BACT|nr:hypothetical protein [Polyangium mundeleinium]MDC0740502.1 hypothetical protein [Polyangium mundeleinium]
MPANTTASLGILTVTAFVAACASAPHPERSPIASAQTAPPHAAKRSAPETPAGPGAAANPPNAPLAEDSPSGTFRGASPFEAPPSGPQPLLSPTPPRPPGTDPTPKEQAQAAASCGAITQCGVCNNWGYCGFCLSTKQCVPKDRNGPYPGSCAVGFSPSDCPMALYLEKDEVDIRERLARLVGTLAPEGMPLDRKAESVSVLRIPVHRGRCYGLVFRGSYDVDGAIDAEAAVEAKFFDDGGIWVPVYREVSAITPFCPQEDGRILLRVTPRNTTKGTWRAQLFSTSITEETLEAQRERYEAERRALALRYSCSYCARVHLGCFLSGEPQCDNRYVVCLGAFGYTPDDCERGDVPKKKPEPKPLEALQMCSPDEPKG